MTKEGDDFERIFRDVTRLTRPSVDPPSERLTPDIEIIEEPDALILLADVPTVEREDIRVDVSPRRVVITGLVRNALDAISGIFRREKPFPGFERSVSLPAEVRPDSAEAHYNNGVLEVVLPKRVLGGAGVYRLPADAA